MTWKPYIFIVGAWSQWDREVVVVEAEKMKNSEEMALAAYVKWMDRHPLFLLLQVVVPSLQSRLRNFLERRGMYGMSFLTSSRTDCSDRHI